MVSTIIAVDSYTYKRGMNFVGGVSRKALQKIRHLREIEIEDYGWQKNCGAKISQVDRMSREQKGPWHTVRW